MPTEITMRGISNGEPCNRVLDRAPTESPATHLPIDARGKLQRGPDLAKRLLAKPWVQSFPWGGSTFGSILDQQPRFRLVGDPACGTFSPIAETQAARDLLAQDASGAVRRLLAGLADLARDPRSGLVAVQGLSLSLDEFGWAANGMAAACEDTGNSAVPMPVGDTEADRQIFGVALSWIARHARSYGAETRDRWINLSPAVTLALLEYVCPDTATSEVSPSLIQELAFLLSHEAQHTVTSHNAHGWLEDALCETLARWPGAGKRAAISMGLHYAGRPSSPPGAGYPLHRVALRRLLRAAGINTSDSRAYQNVLSILQGCQGRLVAGRLARAILKAQQLSPSCYRNLRLGIIAAKPSRRAIDNLLKTIARFDRPIPASTAAPATTPTTTPAAIA